MAGTESWTLTTHDRHHRVEIEGSFTRSLRWYVDDELVATAKSSDDNVQLAPDPDTGQAVGVRFGALGPKRVTLYDAEGDVPAKARAALGVGGIDLDPPPGSAAARREQRIREHPWRHAALATTAGVAKVVVPVLLGLLAVRIAVDLPWPDIPWPDIDLPRIPWPDVDLPDIPWPDWSLPGWVRWVLDKLKYVWPVLLAVVLAKAEIDRRRKQDALKRELRERREEDGR